jgi:hypothetical protein
MAMPGKIIAIVKLQLMRKSFLVDTSFRGPLDKHLVGRSPTLRGWLGVRGSQGAGAIGARE